MNAPRLTNQLLAWILGSLVLLWFSFIVMAYRTGEHEADELTDGHLAAMAALLVNLRGGEFVGGPLETAPTGGISDLKAHDYQQSMTAAIWNSNGTLVTRSGEGPTPEFTPDEGFATVSTPGSAKWRTFSRWNGTRDRKVAVLLSLAERDALAQDIAEQIIQPGLWLLPVLALALGFAVRRGLRPLYALSSEVHALDIRRPQALPTQGRHQEFQAPVEAINALVARYEASLQRERSLADEFAHELRTPLTSLALQVQALRSSPEKSERDEALRRLEADVLRTGDVISHLLALARASRAELNEALQTVDVTELARSTVAEFAPAAYASGRELALDAPGPLHVQGHPVLLELALRNLLDNAIRHTAAGSQVEVQVDPAHCWLQVCDRCAPGPAHQPPDTAPARGVGGLGLGHRVVRKVAEVHGARFGSVQPPPAGYASCYRFSFARPTK